MHTLIKPKTFTNRTIRRHSASGLLRINVIAISRDCIQLIIIFSESIIGRFYSVAILNQKCQLAGSIIMNTVIQIYTIWFDKPDFYHFKKPIFVNLQSLKFQLANV